MPRVRLPVSFVFLATQLWFMSNLWPIPYDRYEQIKRRVLQEKETVDDRFTLTAILAEHGDVKSQGTGRRVTICAKQLWLIAWAPHLVDTDDRQLIDRAFKFATDTTNDRCNAEFPQKLEKAREQAIKAREEFNRVWNEAEQKKIRELWAKVTDGVWAGRFPVDSGTLEHDLDHLIRYSTGLSERFIKPWRNRENAPIEPPAAPDDLASVTEVAQYLQRFARWITNEEEHARAQIWDQQRGQLEVCQGKPLEPDNSDLGLWDFWDQLSQLDERLTTCEYDRERRAGEKQNRLARCNSAVLGVQRDRCQSLERIDQEHSLPSFAQRVLTLCLSVPASCTDDVSEGAIEGIESVGSRSTSWEKVRSELRNKLQAEAQRLDGKCPAEYATGAQNKADLFGQSGSSDWASDYRAVDRAILRCKDGAAADYEELAQVTEEVERWLGGHCELAGGLANRRDQLRTIAKKIKGDQQDKSEQDLLDAKEALGEAMECQCRKWTNVLGTFESLDLLARQLSVGTPDELPDGSSCENPSFDRLEGWIELGTSLQEAQGNLNAICPRLIKAAAAKQVSKRDWNGLQETLQVLKRQCEDNPYADLADYLLAFSRWKLDPHFRPESGASLEPFGLDPEFDELVAKHSN